MSIQSTVSQPSESTKVTNYAIRSTKTLKNNAWLTLLRQAPMQSLGDLPQGLVSGISGLMNSPQASSGQSPNSPLGVSGPNSSDLVFATFNQDTTSLAVGTTSGYKLYSLTSTDCLDPIYENSKQIVDFYWLS